MVGQVVEWMGVSGMGSASSCAERVPGWHTNDQKRNEGRGAIRYLSQLITWVSPT
jgi:hypothetical protein